MVDDSELDYLATFIGKVNTTHTVKTIETVRNINTIEDTQSVLIYSGETIGAGSYSVKRQYKLQYKDVTEAALNSSIYAIVEGIRKLNAREAIAAYTKPNSLIGIKFISSANDYFHIGAGNWYGNNVKIEAEWLIT